MKLRQTFLKRRGFKQLYSWDILTLSFLSDCNGTRVWPVSPVWPNGWMFVYKLSGCGIESRCSQLNFRYRACFEQEVPWQSGKYRLWIHSETRTWHDKNIQSNDCIWNLTPIILPFSSDSIFSLSSKCFQTFISKS